MALKGLNVVRGFYLSRPNCATWHRHTGDTADIRSSSFSPQSPKANGDIIITHRGTAHEDIDASTLNDSYALSADRGVQDGAYAHVKVYHGDTRISKKTVKICKGGYVDHLHSLSWQSLTVTEPIVAGNADPAISCQKGDLTLNLKSTLPDNFDPGEFAIYLPAQP